MRYVSVEVAANINQKLIERYSQGEMIGVKEPNLLDSAINLPFQTMFGDELYKDVFEKAVALFESISGNHPFYNANKRTALACMIYFLFENDYVCVMNEKDAANLTVNFVTGKISFEKNVETIKKHSYRKV